MQLNYVRLSESPVDAGMLGVVPDEVTAKCLDK